MVSIDVIKGSLARSLPPSEAYTEKQVFLKYIISHIKYIYIYFSLKIFFA